MVGAFVWGAVGGAALVLGALIGLYVRVPQRVIGWITGVGAGVLTCSVTLELVAGALRTAGVATTAGALGLGAVTFAGGDWLVNRMGGHGRKRSAGMRDSRANGIVLGSLLDGIPESVAIGMSVLSGGVGGVFVAAVFLSNVPEALSASVGLRRAGHRRSRILALWLGIALASALAALLGNAAMAAATPGFTASVNAYAAGAILAMLASTMFPEATEEGGGPATGLATAAGFLVAVVLTEMG